MAIKKIKLDLDFKLEGGGSILDPTIAYSTYGKLNKDKSNVVWVCHALTGDSRVYEWWGGLFGSGKVFNAEEHFVVCANVLGSHYGTTGPLSENPAIGEKYFHDFPLITVRDMVNLHIQLANQLGIEKINVMIGGSMGGHQALEWSIIEAERIEQLIIIAGAASISPWASAFSASQRMIIEMDSSWSENKDEAGMEGMKLARSVALLSYRSAEIYNQTQARDVENEIYVEKSASYQKHQGMKLAARFNAFSYWTLSKAMDSHDIGRNRGGIAAAFQKIKARALIISIESDLLYPKEEQLNIVKHLRSAMYKSIPSKYGHDGFLIESDALSKTISEFLLVVRSLAVCA